MAGKRVITGPPDFVGVGTQRSGTTWWQRLLKDHPDIRLPRDRRKEQHFFDWFGKTPLLDADIARYHERFARRGGQLAGEWTPRYMRDVWTLPLLKRAAPDARILVMFRDPVERYRSGVLHSGARTPARDTAWLASDAVDRGRYALQLRRVLDRFDPSQVLVLQFERCVRDPLGQYRRTLEFIGADASHVPADLTGTRGTATRSRREPIWDDLRQAITGALEDDVRELCELVPDLDVALWPNFAHLAGPGAEPRPRAAPIVVPARTPAEGPDYVGVGTSESGFARWHELLLEHPEVGAPGDGCLDFFSNFCTRAMTAEDAAAYRACFAGTPARIVGEWSAGYMEQAWAPMLLHRAAPDAKLLVMLVNPVTRYALRLADSLRRRPPAERASTRAAETDFLASSVERGRYALALRALLDLYGRDRILVLQTERCASDPVGQYARTLRFLGADHDFRPGPLAGGRFARARRLLSAAPRLVPADRSPELWPELERALVDDLAPDVAEARELAPDLDLSLWPQFAHLDGRAAGRSRQPAALRA